MITILRKTIFLVIIVTSLLLIDNYRIKTTTYTIESEKIENPITVVQISDFHNASFGSRLAKKIQNANPDLITITGDFIDNQRFNSEIVLELIKDIKDLAPIYYVTGNHESAQYNRYKELEKELKELGVNILHDDIIIEEINGNTMNIMGLDDLSFAKTTRNRKTTEARIESIEHNSDFFTLLLSHRPELFEEYKNKELDLVLTGHAHGGQVRIPFLGGVYAPHQGLFPKLTSGIFESDVDNMKMIISRGLGNSRVPIRVNNCPELVIAKLI